MFIIYFIADLHTIKANFQISSRRFEVTSHQIDFSNRFEGLSRLICDKYSYQYVLKNIGERTLKWNSTKSRTFVDNSKKSPLILSLLIFNHRRVSCITNLYSWSLLNNNWKVFGIFIENMFKCPSNEGLEMSLEAFGSFWAAVDDEVPQQVLDVAVDRVWWALFNEFHWNLWDLIFNDIDKALVEVHISLNVSFGIAKKRKYLPPMCKWIDGESTKINDERMLELFKQLWLCRHFVEKLLDEVHCVDVVESDIRWGSVLSDSFRKFRVVWLSFRNNFQVRQIHWLIIDGSYFDVSYRCFWLSSWTIFIWTRPEFDLISDDSTSWWQSLNCFLR